MWGVNAQPTTDDVRMITIDFTGGAYELPVDHTLHNEVYLNLTNFGTGGLEWWYIPEDPSYGPELQVFPGINGPINLPASSENIQRTIRIVAKDSNGNIINGR